LTISRRNNRVTPRRKLGQVVKTLRETKSLTQVALAKRAKVSQGYLAAIERGLKRNPSLAVLKRLASALGVPVTELLG
jgi:transcriptional regulator with XRE-family HTH domain